jgi:uncharacterized membrane protein SirB2
MWVTIDCRSKNWVEVLTSLGSTVILYTGVLLIMKNNSLVFIPISNSIEGQQVRMQVGKPVGGIIYLPLILQM